MSAIMDTSLPLTAIAFYGQPLMLFKKVNSRDNLKQLQSISYDLATFKLVKW